jgi:uncharacterized protein YggE
MIKDIHYPKSNNMKKFSLFFLPLLLTAYLSEAQVMGNAKYRSQQQSQYYTNQNLNQIQLSGKDELVIEINGLYNKVADSYLAIFHLTQAGKTVEEANQLMNERIEGFQKELANMELNKESVHVDMLSLKPVYELEVQKKLFSKRYNEVPKGFELRKNVHVLYQEEADLAAVMNAAARFEIYDLAKVDYFVQDIAGTFDSLRHEAERSLVKKTGLLSKLGIELDTVFRLAAENSQVAFPQDRYQTYQSFVRNYLQQNYANEDVTRIAKPVTAYYEPISYNKFDYVINPVILQPVVQFTYKLKIIYSLERPQKPTVKNNYFLLSPEGKLEKLNLPQN